MRPYISATLFVAAIGIPAIAQVPNVKTTSEEVVLDLVVRDKKGKPITDLKAEDLTVLDNDVKQKLTSFRLVSGSEATAATSSDKPLDPLRQVRLVTLAFEPLSDITQRRLARSAALDLIKGDQRGNVFYSVVVIDTRLLTLQQFTTDRAAVAKAIERACEGISAPRLSSESDAITAELKRQLGAKAGTGTDANTNVLAAASQTAGQAVTNGAAALEAKLASVMLDMLRLDGGTGALGTRLTLSALKSLVQGLRQIPGRKSVLYFTAGMYLSPELDTPFRNLIGTANRENVTFYSIDTRGVMTTSQTSEAASRLKGAAAASRTTVTRTDGGVTKDEMMASDNAEVSARANVDLRLRELAESTGGFLLGDSNDLRVPLRQVNEEIGTYYELFYNPGIQTYDADFRKITVAANRKDLIHSRSGYFALPPEARAAGLAPFEISLLSALSAGKASGDLQFRSGAAILQPKGDGFEVAVMMEVPLHMLQAKRASGILDVHCSLGALVKDAKGEVVQKITRDRSFHVTADQQRLGNFLEKAQVLLAPGKYTLETAVIDQENSKTGVQRSEFSVPSPAAGGVRISSLLPVRSFTPNAKGLDAAEPFQFQGASITPTIENVVKKAPNSALRVFFTVYPVSGNAAEPSVEIEFLQAGKALTKMPMALPAPDSLGRIPYLMTIPAESIPAGEYEVRATARQGDSNASAATTVRIE